MSPHKLQSQIDQLRTQLKQSQSAKQTKLLQSAITQLEKKLNAEQPARPTLEIIPSAIPKSSKRLKPKTSKTSQQTPAPNTSPKDKTPTPTNAQPDSEKRPPKLQPLANGKTLKAAPGQGQHQLIWHICGEIRATNDGFTLAIDDGSLTIPIYPVRQAKKNIAKTDLPARFFCGLYPRLRNGIIHRGTLISCQDKEQNEEIHAQGFWIQDKQTLLIQSDFKRWGERSRNHYFKLPIAPNSAPPSTGFKALTLTRDQLQLFVAEEKD